MSMRIVLNISGNLTTSDTFTQHYHFAEEVLVNLSFKDL